MASGTTVVTVVTVVTVLTMTSGMSHNHSTVLEQVEDYALGLLDEPSRCALEADAAGCPECSAELRAWQQLVTEHLAHRVPERTPPASLRARVLAAAAATAPQPISVPRPAARPLAPWLAIAATLAAVAAGAYAMWMRGQMASLEDELRIARARAATAETQLAALRESSGALQRVADVLAASDVRRVDLYGNTVAPGASGRAFVSPARGVVFAASNLPAIPDDRVYQLWFVTAKGPVSAGLFRPDAAGGASASSNSTPGAPLKAMAVTVEQSGGVAAPTSNRYYLLGALE